MFSTLSVANLPYYPIEFPRDDAAHFEHVRYPVSTMTEWWYYNGMFTTSNDRHFGYCVFYLYQQSEKNGTLQRAPMLYFLLTDIDQQKVYRLINTNLNITTLDTQKLNVAFGNQITLQRMDDSFYHYLLNINTQMGDGTKVQLSLKLTSDAHRQYMPNNVTGLIPMWDNTNSYYYARTRLNTQGFVEVNGSRLEINPAKSLSWMDHQWGDFKIGYGNHPWVWASIQLNNGLEMDIIGKYHPFQNKTSDLQANILLPNGKYYFTNHLEYIPAERTPGHKYPESYTLRIPELDLNLRLQALVHDQYASIIWEGVSSAVGTYQGKSVSGHAYTENTSIAL